MSDGAPARDGIRQIVVPDHAWDAVVELFRCQGILLGRIPGDAGDVVPTYVMAPSEDVFRRIVAEIADEEEL